MKKFAKTVRDEISIFVVLFLFLFVVIFAETNKKNYVFSYNIARLQYIVMVYAMCTIVAYSPSGHVFRFVALERDFVVHGAGGTATVLRRDTVPANVELLAVVRVRKRRMRQDAAVGADHVSVRTRETVR